MPLPKLPSLDSLDIDEEAIVEDFSEDTEYSEDSLIDTEESLIELSDEDFGNDIEDDFDSTDFFEEINDFEEENFENELEEFEDTEDDFLEDDDFEEEEIVKPIKKKSKSKDKKGLFISIGVIIVLLVILGFLFSVLFSNKEDKPKKTEDKIEISVKDNYPITTVQLTDDKSGIIQAVYENKNNKIILCETSQDDFSANEEKQVEMDCYNLNEENLSKLKLINYNFIEE